jgi:hypothetical protein
VQYAFCYMTPVTHLNHLYLHPRLAQYQYFVLHSCWVSTALQHVVQAVSLFTSWWPQGCSNCSLMPLNCRQRQCSFVCEQTASFLQSECPVTEHHMRCACPILFKNMHCFLGCFKFYISIGVYESLSSSTFSLTPCVLCFSPRCPALLPSCSQVWGVIMLWVLLYFPKAEQCRTSF